MRGARLPPATCIEVTAITANTANEVIALNSGEYARRRKHLMELIGADGIAVLAGGARARAQSRHAVQLPARQRLLLPDGLRRARGRGRARAGPRAGGVSRLFCRERNPERELWDGPRCGPEGGDRRPSAATTRFRSPTSTRSCRACSSSSERVYYSMGGSTSSISACSPGFRRSMPSARAGTRRASSSRSIICCTRCACSRAAGKRA